MVSQFFVLDKNSATPVRYKMIGMSSEQVSRILYGLTEEPGSGERDQR